MGLQILPADIPPPARIRDDFAQHPPPAELTSRFDGYLNDARSAVATEPARQAPEASRPDTEPPTDADQIEAETAPSPDHAGETAEHQPTILAVPHITIATEDSSLTPNPVEPLAESSPSSRQQPKAITPTPSAETTEPGSRQPATTDSPQQLQTLGHQANLSGQNLEQPVNQNTRPAPTSESTTQSGRTATRTLPDQMTPVRELPDGPSPQSPKTSNQTPVQALTSDQSRAFDQSRARQEAVGAHQPSPPGPRLAATQRGALDSPPPMPQQAPDPRSAAAQRAALAPRPTSPLPRPVTIKAGKGDPAAAAFAKFLITAANHTAPGSTGNTAAPSAAGIGQAAGNVPSTALAHQAPVADLVADLLAVRVDGADAIKGAARVLNASGRSGKHEVTMQLDPPELGQIKLQIQMRQHGLSLRVDAQTQAVAKMIESRLTELSDALALHGIRVDRAEVTVRPPASTQADAQLQHDNGPANHGDFDQAATQDQDAGDQGEPNPHRTAEQQLSDPKRSVEDIDGRPYQDDLAALDGLDAETNKATMPAKELSVNLVA